MPCGALYGVLSRRLMKNPLLALVNYHTPNFFDWLVREDQGVWRRRPGCSL